MGPLLLRCWLVLFCLAWGPLALSEPRFPPPEFDTAYQIPEEQHSAARSVGLEYLDVTVLLVALGLAVWFITRKRSRKAVLGLSLFSLLYFGFYRSGCICAIGSVQNVVLALFHTTYALPLTVLIFFVAPLAVALFYGRAFCAAVCPHGALQDVLLVKPVTVPHWLEQGLGILPYLYLGIGVWFAAEGGAFVICRYDPFVGIFRMSGSFTMLLAGAMFLGTSVFIGRPYCRFLCPFGALLHLGAMVSLWQIRITPDTCTQCRLCRNSCPFGAIREPTTARLDVGELARERRRFIRLLAVVPVLMLTGGWLGGQFSAIAAQFHPTVKLAELYLRQQIHLAAAPLPDIDALAYARAEQSVQTILDDAVVLRRNFTRGGWIFGVFAGLVVGARLARFSIRSRRTEFEPDAGSCYACARCFEYCPQERVRVGTWPGNEPLPAMAVKPATTALGPKETA